MTVAFRVIAMKPQTSQRWQWFSSRYYNYEHIISRLKITKKILTSEAEGSEVQIYHI